VVNTLIQLFYNFVWGGRDRIKRSILINSLQNGGLQMIDITSYFEAIKASWVGRYMDSNKHCWSFLMEHHLNTIGNSIALHMNFDDPSLFPLITKIPAFYQQVILAFNKSKQCKKPSNKTDLYESGIWGNTFFTIRDSRNRKNVTLFYKHWVEQNIIYIKDLLIRDGHIIQNYLHDKLENNRNIFSEINKLIISLKPFTVLLGTNIPNDIVYTLPKAPAFVGKITNLNVTNKTCKFYYHRLIELKATHLCLSFWEDTHIVQSVPDLGEIIQSKIFDIKENKIKEFNY
jgi:hypothetical protein